MPGKTAADLLCKALSARGFHVERGVAGIDTAFWPPNGSVWPVTGILAERRSAWNEPARWSLSQCSREEHPGHAYRPLIPDEIRPQDAISIPD